MSNFIDFLLVISKLQSPIYCRYPQGLASSALARHNKRERNQSEALCVVIVSHQREHRTYAAMAKDSEHRICR